MIRAPVHFLRRPVLVPAYVKFDDAAYDRVMEQLRADEALRLVTFIDGSVPGSQVVQGSSLSFTVPLFATLVIEGYGPGGGGGGGNSASSGLGTTPSNTTVAELSLTAGAGEGGKNTWGGGDRPGNGGAATGGDINTSGIRGDFRDNAWGGKGGNAPVGGALGGTGSHSGSGGDGGDPGAGGGGCAFRSGDEVGHGGGSGAYLKKTLLPGQITPGTILSLVAPVGGAGGLGTFHGGQGGDGKLSLAWT